MVWYAQVSGWLRLRRRHLWDFMMPDVLCGGLRLCVQQGLDLALRRGLGEAASCRRPRPRLCYRILPSLHLGKLAGLVCLNFVLRNPPRFMHRVQLIRQAHRLVANFFCNPWLRAHHGEGGCGCGWQGRAQRAQPKCKKERKPRTGKQSEELSRAPLETFISLYGRS